MFFPSYYPFFGAFYFFLFLTLMMLALMWFTTDPKDKRARKFALEITLMTWGYWLIVMSVFPLILLFFYSWFAK